MQKTRFDQLVDFPCHFTFKVMGVATATLPDQVVEVLQQHAPGDMVLGEAVVKVITILCRCLSVSRAKNISKPSIVRSPTSMMSAMCYNCS